MSRDRNRGGGGRKLEQKGKVSRDGSRRGQNSQAGWFKAGAPSANPRGRPPATPLEFKELARCYTMEAVETLAQVLRFGRDGERRQAAQALLDRAWGKAPIPIAGPDGESPAVPQVADLVEQLKKIAGGSEG